MRVRKIPSCVSAMAHMLDSPKAEKNFFFRVTCKCVGPPPLIHSLWTQFDRIVSRESRDGPDGAFSSWHPSVDSW